MKDTTTTHNNDILAVFAGTALLLAIPLLGGWPWNWFDYLVMGILLVGTGLLVALVSRKVKDSGRRWAAITALVVALLLIWAELAVGIFGSPIAGS